MFGTDLQFPSDRRIPLEPGRKEGTGRKGREAKEGKGRKRKEKEGKGRKARSDDPTASQKERS